MTFARLVIVALGLGLAAAALLVSLPLDARAIAGSAGLFAAAVALGPPEVRAFFRTEWAALARLIASIILVGVVVVLARRADARWVTVGGSAGAAVAELLFVLLDPKLRSWVKFLSIDQWKAIDAETERTPAEAGNGSWVVLVVLVVAAVSLTLQEYLGDRGAYERWFGGRGRDSYFDLKAFAWWSGWRVLGYVIIPILAILCMPGQRLRDYHISLRGFVRHLWIYLLMFALILPAVIEASMTASFRHTYPFYRLANRSQLDLWTWEALYAAQFISLEFFFRGFLLQGLRKAMGANAIFVMIVPYCMIHYGKPLPETLGAIGAGVILGTLAMRTRSIWGGVLIHIGVAVTMDVLALRGCPPMGSGRSCGY
jgi:membrane protease YdiL (CAAX protease family)